MGFLDRLLGREKKAEEMPAEQPMREEGMQPEPPPAAPMGQEPGTEGSQPEREQP
jgi:hypothetical protein